MAAIEVRGDHSRRLPGKGLVQRPGRHVERLRVHVDVERSCSDFQTGRRGVETGIADDAHLGVARHLECAQRNGQRLGAVGDADAMRAADVRRELRLECRVLLSVDEPAGIQHRRDRGLDGGPILVDGATEVVDGDGRIDHGGGRQLYRRPSAASSTGRGMRKALPNSRSLVCTSLRCARYAVERRLR